MRHEPKQRHECFLRKVAPRFPNVFDIEHRCRHSLTGKVLPDPFDAFGTCTASRLEPVRRDGHTDERDELILRQVLKGFIKIHLGSDSKPRARDYRRP